METLALEPKVSYQREAPPADAAITGRIHVLRGQKVMLDRDLAELYGVEVKRLKEQVRRNKERFPEDFMFELSLEEDRVLRSQVVTLEMAVDDHSSENQGGIRSQFATLKQGKHSKYTPFAFTEHGILMLANVLRSEQAIAVSIHIIRVFARMREIMLTNQEVLRQLEQLEQRVSGHDVDVASIMRALRQLMEHPAEPRKSIGYKSTTDA
ncbi:MAG: ORF6N domain-containing protein [Flavobacteriales bacterium]|nr:ORF6N domain-containing protein [Flavobacteriales bacterium]